MVSEKHFKAGGKFAGPPESGSAAVSSPRHCKHIRSTPPFASGRSGLYVVDAALATSRLAALTRAASIGCSLAGAGGIVSVAWSVKFGWVRQKRYSPSPARRIRIADVVTQQPIDPRADHVDHVHSHS